MTDLTHAHDLITVQGHTGVHSYSPEETAAFSQHLNLYLHDDPDLAHLLPLDTKSTALLKAVGDGLLLAKFINVAQADTIDVRALNLRKNKDLSLFQINENQTLVINSAKGIGVKVTNIGASELIDGEKNPHMVLGLIWQLVKIHLLAAISLKNHPELIRLLQEGEELNDLFKLPPEVLLLRWFNYHLANAKCSRRVSNFGGDVKDSECYLTLLHQIDPNTCGKSILTTSEDKLERARVVLDNAHKLGVKVPIQANDIASGHPRLNLLFTAAIFNQCPGLEPLSQEEIEKVGMMDDDTGDSREERAFRLWINSLNIDDVYVSNLFEGSSDGLVLLRVLDKIQPGCVDWKKVEKNPSNKFKKVSNCNYVVEVGKSLKFSLVNIGGTDIANQNKKLILGLVWQMMRLHTLNFLKQVQAKKFGDAKEMNEDMIIQWANGKLANSSSKLTSFKDPSLKTAKVFLDLLASNDARIIDTNVIQPGDNEDECLNNAKYAISVARKLGAVIFLLPEDIVEVKPKMILTFVASIMALEK